MAYVPDTDRSPWQPMPPASGDGDAWDVPTGPWLDLPIGPPPVGASLGPDLPVSVDPIAPPPPFGGPALGPPPPPPVPAAPPAAVGIEDAEPVSAPRRRHARTAEPNPTDPTYIPTFDDSAQPVPGCPPDAAPSAADFFFEAEVSLPEHILPPPGDPTPALGIDPTPALGIDLGSGIPRAPGLDGGAHFVPEFDPRLVSRGGLEVPAPAPFGGSVGAASEPVTSAADELLDGFAADDLLDGFAADDDRGPGRRFAAREIGGGDHFSAHRFPGPDPLGVGEHYAAPEPLASADPLGVGDLGVGSGYGVGDYAGGDYATGDFSAGGDGPGEHRVGERRVGGHFAVDLRPASGAGPAGAGLGAFGYDDAFGAEPDPEDDGYASAPVQMAEPLRSSLAGPPDVVPPQPAPAVDADDLTIRAFASLPARWQEVLWYTCVERVSVTEASIHIGLSREVTVSIDHRAREGLRRAWLDMYLAAGDLPPMCQAVLRELSAYSRGALSVGDADEVAAHLESCLTCGEVSAELDELIPALTAVLLPVALEELEAAD